MKRGMLAALCALLLGGCMYPADRAVQPQGPYSAQLQEVQRAVEAFQSETKGLLPIKNSEADADPYLRHAVDFGKLIPRFLEKAPASSYEGGGFYQYIIWDAEAKPSIKVIDLRAVNAVRQLELQVKVNRYGPVEKSIADGVYKLDYSQMGLREEPTVQSPYSSARLPLVADGKGRIYIDYSIDLQQALAASGKRPKRGEDIRPLLFQKNPVLPVFSLRYTVNDKGEAIFAPAASRSKRAADQT